MQDWSTLCKAAIGSKIPFCMVGFCILSLGTVRAEVTCTQSRWQDVAGELTGGFSDPQHWDTGKVPALTTTEIINGYFFHADTDYTVTVSGESSPNYLHVGQDYNQNKSGKTKLVITKDMTLASPNTVWAGYRPEKGDVQTDMSKRGLWLIGRKASAEVCDGAELKIAPVINDSTWYSQAIVKLTDGASLLVTNATLTLDNLTKSGYSNQHLRFESQGAPSATCRVDIVKSTVNYTGADEGESYGYAWRFKEYSLLRFYDSDLFADTFVEATPSADGKPSGEVRFEGASRYISTRTTYGTFFRSGRMVFADDSCFTNAANVNNTFIFSSLFPGAPCEIETHDRAFLDFDGPKGANEVRLNTKAGCTTRLTLDSDATSKCRSQISLGYEYGTGELILKKGLLSMGGRPTIAMGFDPGNTEGVCPTGHVLVAGGNLTMNAGEGTGDLSGLIAGCSYRPKNGCTTSRAYGEFEMTSGCVTNGSSTWIGAGYGTGKMTMTGGEYQMRGHFVVGLAGGKGECRILGGSVRGWEAHQTEPDRYTSYLFVGGIPQTLMAGDMNKTAMPATYPWNRHDAEGYLCISNASFRTGQYGRRGLTVGSDGTGTVELMDGASMELYHLYMTNGANARLKFTLAGDNPPVLKVKSQLAVSAKAKLTVDARGYTGEENWIHLVRFDNDRTKRWGSYRGTANGDYFDADCIETLGDVSVVQVHDADVSRRATGIWAHIKRGMVILLR